MRVWWKQVNDYYVARALSSVSNAQKLVIYN